MIINSLHSILVHDTEVDKLQFKYNVFSGFLIHINKEDFTILKTGTHGNFWLVASVQFIE